MSKEPYEESVLLCFRCGAPYLDNGQCSNLAHGVEVLRQLAL